jgi:heme-degrading monooxygenase HmoA
MFARIVSMQLKPNTQKEFTQTFEKEIIPTLKQQLGFQDEILFVVPGGPEVVAISLWDSKENAETYNRATYPEMLKTLANLVEPTPKVQTYDVAYSTFHKIATRVAA